MEGIVAVWTWIMEHLLYINLVLSILIVFFQRRDPKAVWTWLLILYFVPVFGFFFYLIFAQDFHKSRMFRIKEMEDRLRYSVENQERILRRERGDLEDPLSADYADLVYYNLEQAGAVLTLNNDVEIFTDGQKKFEDLRSQLRQAQDYIHIQYYIIKNDELFDSIAPILKERAAHGVAVRILYDGMGGRFMPKVRWEELRKAGILVGCFFPPVLGRLNLRVNYRNHRKTVVIDGRVGYVGGFNIGREYLGRNPRFGYWRDTHLRITGDAVISLQIRFALDWNYATKENLFKEERYFKTISERGMQAVSPGSTLGIQIIASGPDSHERQIRDNYLQLMHKARHHIYIQTPYFVPDDAVLSALKIAAKSGIDVRLMIPCKPDHPFVYWATYSYVGEMVEAGARCYTYENGFLHAKCVMADSRVCCCGTANMDIRSFELNFEVNAMIYDEETTERMEAAFLDDLTRCREVTREVYEARSLWVRIREQGSRLLSPLL
ncbi:MAG: cardiolipin synthase [Lachnospiraceae bacterium]|nr:cardiolipin synthase [Lachnospiraceae bacterium]